jgi:hypothetical protein
MRGWSLKVDEGLYNFGFWILVSRSKEEEDWKKGNFVLLNCFLVSQHLPIPISSDTCQK